MAPIIQPFKWKPKFSVGANGIAAAPIGKNISVLRGGGATLGMAISDKMRVDVVASSGELDYKITEHKPRWSIPKDPRGPGSPSFPNPSGVDLHKIEGHQRRQQVGVNLSYLLSSKGWVTPKIEAGYAWQRISSQTAKFEFRDRITGLELYTIERSESQTLKNLWHVGAGVEKSFGSFTADSATPKRGLLCVGVV